jgi:hypothetical protein
MMRFVWSIAAFVLVLTFPMRRASALVDFQVQQTVPNTPDGTSYSVAIDGTTAIVGAPNCPRCTGSASAYTFDGKTWTLQATLLPTDSAVDDLFGFEVSLSGDTAVISGGGAFYAFVRNGSTWSQQQKILAPAGVSFGPSTLAFAGNVFVVGVPNSNLAVVYTRNVATWLVDALFQPSDSASTDEFGSSVAITGNTVLVGAPFQSNGPLSSAGSVYVFATVSGVWSQVQKLQPSDPSANALFGLSIGANGSTAFIGGSNTYVYNSNGSTWAQTQELPPVSGVGIGGGGIAVSGSLALLAGQSFGAGAAHVFQNIGGTWSYFHSIREFGTTNPPSVAISGTELLLGAPLGAGGSVAAAFFAQPPAIPAFGAREVLLLGLLLGWAGILTVRRDPLRSRRLHDRA